MRTGFNRMTRPSLRTLLCVAAMLLVAPLVVVTTLVLHDPKRWGGSVNPLNIVVSWAEAGGIAGAFTFALVCLIYRYVPRNG